MRRWVCALAMLIPSCGGAQAERSETPPARSGTPPPPAASAPTTEAPAATSDTTGPDAPPTAATRPDEPPGLAANHIADVVNDSYAVFNDCFRRVARTTPKLAGTVVVTWQVAPSGEVADAKVVRGSLVDERVHGCIVRVLEQLRFDPAERPTPASWTFAFGRAD